MHIGARAYAEVDKAGRVAGADAHQLVLILFEEAIAELRAAARAIERADLGARSRHLSRAATIVAALDYSLDHERGGDVARSLSQVYAYARARMTRAASRNDAAEARVAADALSEIAAAWRAIR
ncbi:MAG: flagellar export chaperone FliS [Sphingomonadaceae bacterium]